MPSSEETQTPLLCPWCRYEIAELGQRCPECGEVVIDAIRPVPKWTVIGTVSYVVLFVLLVAVGLLALFGSDQYLPLLFVAHGLQYIGTGAAYKQRHHVKTGLAGLHIAAMIVMTAFALLTLVLLTVCCLQPGASPVAQIAGSDWRWSLWLDVFLLLWGGSAITVLVSLILLIIKPYAPMLVLSWTLPALNGLVGGLMFVVLMQYAPTA